MAGEQVAVSTALAVIPDQNEYERLKDMASTIAEARGFIPDHFLVDPARARNKLLAAMLTGLELGIGPMEAVRSIQVIKGKATLSAELMVALIRRRGHSIQGEVSPTRAKVVGKRCDSGDAMSYEFTLEMARRAGLISPGGAWEKYPESMCWARAVSQLARMLFADVLVGVSYTPEELNGDPPAPPLSVGGSADAVVVGGPIPEAALPPTEEVVDTRSGELGESQNHGQPAAPLSEQEPPAASTQEPRKRGRPPGRKNRPKEEEPSPPLGAASESAPPVEELGNFDNADGLVPEAPPPPPLSLDPLQETRDRVWELAMKLRAKQYALLGREVGGEELIEKTSQALSIYLQNQYGEKTALIDLNGYQLEETLEHVQGELAKRGG